MFNKYLLSIILVLLFFIFFRLQFLSVLAIGERVIIEEICKRNLKTSYYGHPFFFMYLMKFLSKISCHIFLIKIVSIIISVFFSLVVYLLSYEILKNKFYSFLVFLFLITSPLFFTVSGYIYFDMIFSLYVMSSLYLYFKNNIVGFLAMLLCSLMTKNYSILLVPVLFIFLAIKRDITTVLTILLAFLIFLLWVIKNEKEVMKWLLINLSSSNLLVIKNFKSILLYLSYDNIFIFSLNLLILLINFFKNEKLLILNTFFLIFIVSISLFTFIPKYLVTFLFIFPLNFLYFLSYFDRNILLKYLGMSIFAVFLFLNFYFTRLPIPTFISEREDNLFDFIELNRVFDEMKIYIENQTDRSFCIPMPFCYWIKYDLNNKVWNRVFCTDEINEYTKCEFIYILPISDFNYSLRLSEFSKNKICDENLLKFSSDNRRKLVLKTCQKREENI